MKVEREGERNGICVNCFAIWWIVLWLYLPISLSNCRMSICLPHFIERMLVFLQWNMFNSRMVHLRVSFHRACVCAKEKVCVGKIWQYINRLMRKLSKRAHISWQIKTLPKSMEILLRIARIERRWMVRGARVLGDWRRNESKRLFTHVYRVWHCRNQ